MLAFGDGIQRCQLLGGEADGDHLHRLGAAPWSAATASLQLVDVVAGFGFVGPPLDLLSVTTAISYDENTVTAASQNADRITT